MKLAEIRELPTILAIDKPNGKSYRAKYHESLFRSYQILGKVKELIEMKAPFEIIQMIIEDLQDAPPKDKIIRD